MKKPTAFDGVGAWMRTWLEPVVSGRLPSVTCSICTTGGRGSPVDTTSGLSDQALSRRGAISSCPLAQIARPMNPVEPKSSDRPESVSR